MSTIKVDNLLNSTGDQDSGLDLSTNDQIILKTANTTAITVNSSQNTTLAGNLVIPNAGTIGSSSDTDAIAISSAGIVTKSAHPAFFATGATNDWRDNIAVNTNIVLDHTKHNQGNHYNTTTGKFTAPINGVYSFQFGAYVKNGSGTALLIARLDDVNINYTNSAYPAVSCYTQDADTNDEVIGMSWTYYMTANQTMSVASGDAGTDYFASMTWFSGFLVG